MGVASYEPCARTNFPLSSLFRYPEGICESFVVDLIPLTFTRFYLCGNQRRRRRLYKTLYSWKSLGVNLLIFLCAFIVAYFASQFRFPLQSFDDYLCFCTFIVKISCLTNLNKSNYRKLRLSRYKAILIVDITIGQQ